MVRPPVDQEVIDDTSVFQAHGRILGLPDVQVGSIVDRDLLDQIECLRAPKDELSHMADIEETRAGTDAIVLGVDPGGILDRHLEPGERHELPPVLHVSVIKRGLPELFSH
jgi:hypothetical protein